MNAINRARSAPFLPPGQLLTLREVATQLRLSEKTVRRLVARGDLLALRLGRSLRIAEDDLRAYLNRCR